ncbi:hypothetical protein DPEC_G00089940 [Dallia pectoralis]|uniref:Uncharacterized protein n=1 Tax=Dallia pectoralis TaxID=75939 RepID=A0ACC2H192_DALPE|nr:hypothetical protein DPEC_G00089940 [Dallia pectoralis]
MYQSFAPCLDSCVCLLLLLSPNDSRALILCPFTRLRLRPIPLYLCLPLISPC